MFRGGRGSHDPLLPTAGGIRNGGATYSRRTGAPKLSKSFIASVMWAVGSMMLIVAGYMYCLRRVETASVTCTEDSCQVIQLRDGVTTSFTISREHMVRSEAVRIKNGQVVEAAGLRRSQQRQLGYSYAVVYVEPDSEDDDDESYEAFADDDDSFDSYDDSEDSSADDDDDVPRPQGNAKPGQKPTETNPSKKPFVSSLSDAEKATQQRIKTNAEKREAQRQRWAADREKRGLPPLREPDDKRRGADPMRKARKPDASDGADAGNGDQDEERFPGDPGTMPEGRNRQQIDKMGEQMGTGKRSQDQHREEAARSHAEAAKRHADKQAVHTQAKRIGNNLHDRANPDDPDNKRPRPGLERQQGTRDFRGDEEGNKAVDADDMDKGQEMDVNVDGGAGDEVEDREAGENELQALEKQMEDLQNKMNEVKNHGGGRTISSIHGPEDVNTDTEDEALYENLDVNAPDGQGMVSGGRKLLWRGRAKRNNIPPSKPNQEQLNKDTTRDRDVHYSGHGHHHKRRKKVAEPGPDDSVLDQDSPTHPRVDRKKTVHHHKGFHHKKPVDPDETHHVHEAYHHKPGEKKVEHGFKHQNRQWHAHEQRTLLATRYNVGRRIARQRKDAINNYIFKRGPEAGQQSVKVSDTKRWRAGGIWVMLLGAISLCFCLVIGNFEPRPKGKKAS